MRKSFLPVLMAGTLALGGCAGGLGGMGGPMDPVGAILGSVLSGAVGGGSGGYGQNSGYGNQSFQNAAVNACGSQASRYGRVSVTNVQQVSSSTLQVYGTVDVNGGFDRRPFVCNFRSDGRITGFDVR